MLSKISMLRWGIIAVVILLIDQASKWLVLRHLDLEEAVQVMPGFNLQLAFNKGAAFGFLSQHSGWQRFLFVGLAIFVSISILVWLYRLNQKQFLDGLALSVILGGALGNLLDRIRFGQVIDFIDIYYQNWHWYTFNIADIAICIGAAILMLTLFVKGN